MRSHSSRWIQNNRFENPNNMSLANYQNSWSSNQHSYLSLQTLITLRKTDLWQKILHIICAFSSLVIHIKNFLCHKFDSSVKFFDDGRAVGTVGGGRAYDRLFKWGTDYAHHITKGQLNSEWIYEVIVSPKMPIKNLKDFCPGRLLEGMPEILRIFGWQFGRKAMTS